MVGNLGYRDGCHLLAAAAYLGLKVGAGVRGCYPYRYYCRRCEHSHQRNKALGENVMIQSIGACSGAVVAGAIFTLPAIYILQAKYPR